VKVRDVVSLGSSFERAAKELRHQDSPAFRAEIAYHEAEYMKLFSHAN
jgi:hypothetical protein